MAGISWVINLEYYCAILIWLSINIIKLASDDNNDNKRAQEVWTKKI